MYFFWVECTVNLNIFVEEFRFITQFRSGHVDKLNGQSKLIRNEWDKLCDKCDSFEEQTIEHTLNCDYKIDKLTDLTDLLNENDLELNTDNILYPFEKEILKERNKINIMELIITIMFYWLNTELSFFSRGG